jgi:hypothetical protein
MKASELFEGPNSSLRKAFNEATSNPELTVESVIEAFRTKYRREDGLIDKYVYTPDENDETGMRIDSTIDHQSDWLKEKLTTLQTQHREQVQKIYSHFSWCQECAEGPICNDALAIATSYNMNLTKPN